MECAFFEGASWVLAGNAIPDDELELDYVLDLLMSEDGEFWAYLIEQAGQEAIDAAFYAGCVSERIFA